MVLNFYVENGRRVRFLNFNKFFMQQIDHRSICVCPDGYTGNALFSCFTIGCRSNSDCSSHESCINKECIDPCKNIKCASSAFCRTENHQPRYLKL